MGGTKDGSESVGIGSVSNATFFVLRYGLFGFDGGHWSGSKEKRFGRYGGWGCRWCTDAASVGWIRGRGWDGGKRETGKWWKDGELVGELVLVYWLGGKK